MCLFGQSRCGEVLHHGSKGPTFTMWHKKPMATDAVAYIRNHNERQRKQLSKAAILPDPLKEAVFRDAMKTGTSSTGISRPESLYLLTADEVRQSENPCSSGCQSQPVKIANIDN